MSQLQLEAPGFLYTILACTNPTRLQPRHPLSFEFRSLPAPSSTAIALLAKLIGSRTCAVRCLSADWGSVVYSRDSSRRLVRAAYGGLAAVSLQGSCSYSSYSEFGTVSVFLDTGETNSAQSLQSCWKGGMPGLNHVIRRHLHLDKLRAFPVPAA